MTMNFLNNYLKVLNKFKPKAIIFSYLDPLIFINKKKLLSDDKIIYVKDTMMMLIGLTH